MREDREPSVVCESISPNPKNVEKETAQKKKNQRKGLFLRVSTKDSLEMRKINLLLEIFEGDYPVYAFYEDTKKYEALGFVKINEPMMNEMNNILGDSNVVIR